MTLNVMIVDDEAHIRSGIKAKVDWAGLGMAVAAEAGDGAEALEKMGSCEIDVVITDIAMPEMDGLGLIRKAAEIGHPAKFVIVSGYGEFEYARTAMKYGISEYLLKPLKSEEMLASLEKIREEIRVSEGTWRKEKADRETAKRREEALLHWLSDKHPPASSAASAEWAGGNALIGLLKADLAAAAHDASDGVRNPTLYARVESACQKLMETLGRGFFVRNVRPEHDYILLFYPETSADKDALIRRLFPFAEELERSLGVRVTVGLGSVSESAEAVRKSYREALFAMKERIMPSADRIIDYARIPSRNEKPNFSADTKLLLRFLKEKKWDKAKEHIQHMFRQAVRNKTGANHNHAYELFFEIYLVIKQFSQEEAAVHDAESAGFDGDLTDIVAGFHLVDQMVDWLYQYLESSCRHLIGGQDASGKDIVYRVKEYIKEFCSSDLTLNAISEKYHINPIYFSRIFKTYVGESFNGYLTRIRMEEARNLMSTTSLKLQEISEIVGYDDPKYFSKVFKKFFGVSPSQYAEQAVSGTPGGRN
ncbi:response regulator [Cohnella caldifontis]|uniref:response regulator n=1 Tax=Cohnella caldifontis TaxID=3027471 RepID=UPI0023EB95E1|nr:helix-turn-helix domain-containing protein [Cohnella sp. YIM B05605]